MRKTSFTLKDTELNEEYIKYLLENKFLYNNPSEMFLSERFIKLSDKIENCIQIEIFKNSKGVYSYEIIKTYSKEELIYEYLKKKDYVVFFGILVICKFTEEELLSFLDYLPKKQSNFEPFNYIIFKYLELKNKLTEKIINKLISVFESDFKSLIFIAQHEKLTGEQIDNIIEKVLSVSGEKKSAGGYGVISSLLSNTNIYSQTIDKLINKRIDDELIIEKFSDKILLLPQTSQKVLRQLLSIYKDVNILSQIIKHPNANNYMIKEIIESNPGRNDIILAILEKDHIDEEIFNIITSEINNKKWIYNSVISGWSKEKEQKLLEMFVNHHDLQVKDIESLIINYKEYGSKVIDIIGSSNILSETILFGFLDRSIGEADYDNFEMILQITKAHISNKVKKQSEDTELPKINFKNEYFKVLKKYISSDILMVRAKAFEELYWCFAIVTMDDLNEFEMELNLEKVEDGKVLIQKK